METSKGVLSYDIVLAILSRLPVKSLLRFRCVCKAWYVLFKSPSFITEHLKNENDARLLVNYMFDDEEDVFSYPRNLYCLFPDEMLIDLSMQDINFPEHLYEISGGPYDGIFCMRGNTYYTLCNLATKETRVLPKFRAIPHCTRTYCTNFGFGLDIMSNDYKFVMMLSFWDTKKRMLYEFSHVAVYNLSTNNWRDSVCFKSSHYFMDGLSDGIYLDGVCYWLTNFEINFAHKVILSFHLSDETFEEMQLLCIRPSKNVVLGLYEHSLSLLCFDEENNCFDTWMMKKKCFTKILSVGPFVGVQLPLGYWKKGAFLLHSNSGKLLLCDPNSTQELRDLGLKSYLFSVYTYKESVLTIKGDDNLFELFDIPWHILGVTESNLK